MEQNKKKKSRRHTCGSESDGEDLDVIYRGRVAEFEARKANTSLRPLDAAPLNLFVLVDIVFNCKIRKETGPAPGSTTPVRSPRGRWTIERERESARARSASREVSPRSAKRAPVSISSLRPERKGRPAMAIEARARLLRLGC